MARREYLIGPEFNLPKVLAKARSLAARAEAKGLSGGYNISIEDRILPAIGAGKPKQAQFLIIEGEPVRYAGWQFVAVAEWINGQPVVSGSPWYEGEQVDRASLREGGCDHCKADRRRNKVIIVENEAGQRKQVGSSCVKDFLGAEVNGAWFSDKDPFDEFGGYAGSGGIALESFSEVLFWAASVIRTKGWVSKSASEYGDKQSSVSWVKFVMGPRPSGRYSDDFGREWDAMKAAVNDDDRAAAERAFAYGQAMEGDSDYAMNVRAVFSTGESFAKSFFDPKHIGLVVSVVGMMLKAEGKAAQEAAEAAQPIVEELFAEPKAKIQISGAVVSDVIAFESAYGSGQIIVMIGEGYRFKWMTSSAPGLSVGDVIDFKASVKGKDEFNGKVSTQVLRVKVLSSQSAAA